ncbi:hypothetical protein TUBRATIS_002810 [Tubulinosema ratisbonensis]|uniref:Uncharacterized protein n=1 Tax=Tubulinosema ratisbonensis TaxID=291195 RepID=A0A437AQ11_9MICR|nr:hypothetical protein TUBRATIS_002810 [Tubulinosema ratisbonensis]
MQNSLCVSCKEVAYTEIRKVFYCINCFKETVHRKIKRNIHLCSIPKRINILFDMKKEDYVVLSAIKEIYFANNNRNQREFFLVSNQNHLDFKANDSLNFQFLKECIKKREEDLSVPKECCLFNQPIEKICYNSLNFILKNEPEKLKKNIKSKFIFQEIEFVNSLTNVSAKEIEAYFNLIKEKKEHLKKEEITESKEDLLIKDFLNELEEKNCGFSFNFLQLLKKLEK